MTDLLALATFAAAYIAILTLVAHVAPLGWEDTNGFHFGPCPGERDQQGASGGNTKFERPVLPTGSVYQNIHNEANSYER